VRAGFGLPLGNPDVPADEPRHTVRTTDAI
jgi:hypothetical protein